MDARAVDAACAALARGGVVAYPTEAVYGLGCDPANHAAVDRLLLLKRRDAAKGLILIAAEVEAFSPWIQPLDDALRARIEPTWPGPVTWLVPAADDCPRNLRGDHATLAVRVTAHPEAAALCRAWGGALVSTSANRADAPPIHDAVSIRRRFGADIDVVLEGHVGDLARPTPIRDARTGATIRE